MDALRLQTKIPSEQPDDYAPDKSEIRFLLKSNRGSMVHCTLPVGQASIAVKHRTVEEFWYFLSGRGQVWRRFNGTEDIQDVHAGISLDIPLGTTFQFKNTGDESLQFVIVTIPPWPGDGEATKETGYWK